MPHRFTRQELYDLVWSAPVQAVAKTFSLSDRGLAKICTAANIPVPARGYWAKKEAGKPASKPRLPPRDLGQQDLVVIGREQYDRSSEDAEIFSSPIPPVPAFEPSMEVVQKRAAAMVAKAPLPIRGSRGWHSQIQRLLDADELRAKKQRESAYPSIGDGPIFSDAFEKRRLRILNALFTCLTRCGAHPHIDDKHGRTLGVTVGTTSVPLSLDSLSAAKQIERERQGYGFVTRGPKDRMRLALQGYWSTRVGPSWEDKPGHSLEKHLREIATAILVFAEKTVRDNTLSAHDGRIKRKAELEERERQRLAEEERVRLERRLRFEKAQVEHLLAQAEALNQARQIRAYVDAVTALNATAPNPMTHEELQAWTLWALAQADRIDPVASGTHKTRPPEPAD